MKRLILVLQLLLNERFSALRLSNLRRSDGKLDVSKLLLFLVLTVGCGYLLWKVWALQGWMAEQAKRFAHPEAPSAIIMLGMVTAILVSSLVAVVSKLYLRKSLIWFANLPVSPWKVLVSVLGDIWLTTIALSAVVMTPALYYYSVAVNGGVLFWVRAVWMLLFMPLIPLAIVTTVATAITWIAGKFRLGSTTMLVLASAAGFLFINLQISGIKNLDFDNVSGLLMNFLFDREFVLKLLSTGFPPILWAFRGLEGDLNMFLLYTGVSLASVALVVWLIQPIYMKMVVKQSETSARRRKAVLSERTLRPRRPFGALFQRELMEIVKTPIYIMNSLTGMLIFPIIMVISALGIRASTGANEIIAALNNTLNEASPTTILFVLSIIIGLSASMNQAMATAVSREGKRRDLIRILPASPRTHITAKLCLGLLYNVLSIAATGGVLIAIFPAMAMNVLYAMLLALLISSASGTVMLTLDAVRPNFHWKSEMNIYKQSATVLIAMVVGLIFLAIPVLLHDLFIHSLSPDIQLVTMLGVCALLVPLSFIALYTIGLKRYQVNMENGL